MRFISSLFDFIDIEIEVAKGCHETNETKQIIIKKTSICSYSYHLQGSRGPIFNFSQCFCQNLAFGTNNTLLIVTEIMPHLHEVECNLSFAWHRQKERTLQAWDKGGLRERHSTVAGPDGW